MGERIRAEHHQPVTYSDLSLAGRLAVALHCFEDYCHALDLQSPLITEFINHLWNWLNVNWECFDEWYYSGAILIAVADGGEYPPELETFLLGHSVDPLQFRRLVTSVADVIYISLFGGANDKRSLHALMSVVEIVKERGIEPPPAAYFKNSPFSDGSGCGNHLSPEEQKAWRQLLCH